MKILLAIEAGTTIHEAARLAITHGDTHFLHNDRLYEARVDYSLAVELEDGIGKGVLPSLRQRRFTRVELHGGD